MPTSSAEHAPANGKNVEASVSTREPESQVRRAAPPAEHTPSKAPPPALDPALYLNREILLAGLNARVLAEALIPSIPCWNASSFWPSMPRTWTSFSWCACRACTSNSRPPCSSLHLTGSAQASN